MAEVLAQSTLAADDGILKYSLLPKGVAFIDQFEYVTGETPLSSYTAAVGLVIYYLGGIALCKQIVKMRGKPFDLKWAVLALNGSMSVLAGLVFYTMCIEIAHLLQTSSLWDFYCDSKGSFISGRIQFLYYVHYLMKMIEFTDTFLLALRGKPTTFLHVYHHGMVAVFGALELSQQICCQFIAHMLNLAVHVVLYGYFVLQALKIDVWWKRYLTQFQVVQFILVLLTCLPALGSRILWEINPSWGQACHGTWFGVFFGIAVIASYLYLFADFYLKTYNQNKKNKLAKKSS